MNHACHRLGTRSFCNVSPLFLESQTFSANYAPREHHVPCHSVIFPRSHAKAKQEALVTMKQNFLIGGRH